MTLISFVHKKLQTIQIFYDENHFWWLDEEKWDVNRSQVKVSNAETNLKDGINSDDDDDDIEKENEHKIVINN